MSSLDAYVDVHEAYLAMPITERFKYSIVLAIMHDCLKILKFLSLQNPEDAIAFTTDNLLFKNGHVVLSECYLSKVKIKRELVLQDKCLSCAEENNESSSFSQKLWQVQNLQFIAFIAC